LFTTRQLSKLQSIIFTGAYSLYPSPEAKTGVQTLTVAEACPRTTTCYNPKGFPISSVKSAIYIEFAFVEYAQIRIFQQLDQ
jgi:hypothetical protein